MTDHKGERGHYLTRGIQGVCRPRVTDHFSRPPNMKLENQILCLSPKGLVIIYFIIPL